MYDYTHSNKKGSIVKKGTTVSYNKNNKKFLAQFGSNPELTIIELLGNENKEFKVRDFWNSYMESYTDNSITMFRNGGGGKDSIKIIDNGVILVRNISTGAWIPSYKIKQ